MESLAVRNWSRYQHYGDRRPPWVKFYVDTLEDEGLCGLSVPSRLVAALILLIAANRGNKLPDDPTWLAVECSVTRPQAKRALADLREIKFLVPASEVASTNASEPSSNGASKVSSGPASASRAPADSRRGRDRERNPLSPFSDPASKRTCPDCGISVNPPTTLADHMYVTHGKEAA